ncbi:Alcohol dehydrogenase [Providencia heimbachae]|nr:Alcohol dehydrogenase [Providencia heimbachae]
MKEIIVSENNKLEIKEVDIPQCSNNDVLVKVAYSGLCGSDIPRIFHHGAHSYPIRLGHEFTGHIVDIGKDVSTVNIRDSAANLGINCFIQNTKKLKQPSLMLLNTRYEALAAKFECVDTFEF